jgi:hypothetical protein
MLLKQFAAALREIAAKREITTIVDLFGGSGLLSHAAKQTLPDCRVVWNDFDDFSARLRAIPHTNALLAELRNATSLLDRRRKIDNELGRCIREIIERADAKGYVDYLTLSSSLLFTVHYAKNWQEFSKETMYNNPRTTDYNADGYLAGVERVRLDYRELFAMYSGRADVLFVADPPYLNTQTKGYLSGSHWKLKDCLDALNILRQNNYVYFTSSKSQLVELYDWLGANTNLVSPFDGATIKTHEVGGHCLNYTDIMLYKVGATGV